MLVRSCCESPLDVTSSLQKTGLRQLLTNLFKSRSPKLVQTGSWKPNLFDSVPKIPYTETDDYVVYFIFGAAQMDEHLCSSTCHPETPLPSSAIRLSRSVFPPVHPPSKCTVSPLARSHTRSYCSPPGIHSVIVFAAVLFWTCGTAALNVACGDGCFAGTCVLGVQINVLSFDVLTVHVLINWPWPWLSSSSDPFFFFFVILFTSCSWLLDSSCFPHWFFWHRSSSKFFVTLMR